MVIDKTSAAIDNDFLSHVAEINRTPEEIHRIFSETLMALGVKGIIHPLIYEKEVPKNNMRIMSFFEKSIIGQPTLGDILRDDKARISYYCYTLSELYRSLKGTSLPPETDVFAFWKKGESLGEIHSVAMCLLCDCGIFLSDDGDSKALKTIVEQKNIGAITVYDRGDVMKQYQKTEFPALARKDRQAFAHKKTG